MDFCDSLANDGQRGGGAGAGCEFFVDVESRLVFLTSLQMGEPEQLAIPFVDRVVTMLDTYDTQTNPRLGQVDKQRVLSPALGSLNFLQSKVGSVLLKVNLNDQGNAKFHT